jgi:hypothetical protein
MKYPDPLKVCPLSKDCSHVDGYLCDPNTCSSIIVHKLSEWLGEDGIKFFKDIKEKHGTVQSNKHDCCYLYVDVNKRKRRPRVIYEEAYGSIPSGLVI